MTDIQIMDRIRQKIEEYPIIMLFRHMRMDGDCVGATRGLQEVLRSSYPEKTILLIDAQHSDYLDFAGQTDPEVPEEVYRQALAIVLDVANRDRISNQRYSLCREIIKIDHHIPVDEYGVLNWVEEERSSVCEMAAALCAHFRDDWTLTKEAATWLYMGMVTDSGRFRFRGVNGDTLRLAGMLLDRGVDTETLYARLYLDEFEDLQFQAYVLRHMHRTENGVAWILIDRPTQERFCLNFETACNAIGYLDRIKGCLCWLAFIECEDPDEGIRVRLRSRFMTVDGLANRYHGGGHACASGATVWSQEELESLIRDADALTLEYKTTHEGWM